jgi:uncharacterized small protein (DUF1192 family)
MMEETAAPRPLRGWALSEMATEDLEPYSSHDLEERIARLEGEIDRTRAVLDKKRHGRAAAEAFFRLG